MNTPLEVMKAIVENGGPIEAWVRTADRPLIGQDIVLSIILVNYGNLTTSRQHSERYGILLVIRNLSPKATTQATGKIPWKNDQEKPDP